MLNALIIVWRESVEAILVVSILYAWVREHGGGDVRPAHLWSGVAAGVVLAAVLAGAMLGVRSQLAGAALEAFQALIVFAAAALITQMVFWMRRHGRHIRRQLETGMQQAALGAGGVAAAALAAIAVAREGAETVLFLYGVALEQRGASLAAVLTGAALGFGLALATAWLIAQGRRVVSWRTFFAATETLLLLLAAALVVSGTEKLIGLEWLPAMVEPLSDTSAVLDDAGGLGGIVAAFTGYRARPSLTVVLVYVAYWTAVGLLLLGRGSGQSGRSPASRDAPPPRRAG
ncbi:MAG: FTR1 family protein [Burkholderiales bacterium]